MKIKKTVQYKKRICMWKTREFSHTTLRKYQVDPLAPIGPSETTYFFTFSVIFDVINLKLSKINIFITLEWTTFDPVMGA